MAKSKEQKAAYMREYNKRKPASQKQIDLKRRFGISLEDYEAMLEKQNGVCAVCGNPETVIDSRTNEPRSLAVDHCHTTKKVRGLLCMGCNQGLGNFRDNPEFLAKAISYLLN